MRIYIDTETGTWGALDSLRVVTMLPEQMEILVDMSDSELCRLGLERGQRVETDS